MQAPLGSTNSRPVRVLLVMAAWLPLYALWMLFVLGYGEGVSLTRAAAEGLTTIGVAALLGFGVWWISGWFAWPDRLRAGFYLGHLGMGALYSVLLVGTGYVVGSVRMGVSIADLVRESRVVGWQFILGLVLYGLVAGISYAIRAGRRAEEQRELRERADALAARARLAALRARLDPHFLFNALHTVGALIRDDPQTAEDAIEQLASLLRQVVEEDGRDVRTVAEEWTFTREYLELEKLRFGSRLVVETDLQPEALDREIPLMTLQPLVENAVRHGVEPSIDTVTVRVAARVESGDLVIVIADDAPPPAAPVARDDSVRPTPGAGGALRSLDERLGALFGPAAEMTTEASEAGGFTVRIRLPMPRRSTSRG